MLTTADKLTLDPDHPLAGIDLSDVAARTYDRWFARGVDMYADDAVLAVDVAGDRVVAVVSSARGGDGYVVQLTAGQPVDATCDCPVRQRHRALWCKHRVAVALACLAADPDAVRSRYDQLAYADGRTASDVPADWTTVAPSGAVRHITSRKHGTLTAACGRTFDPAEVTSGDEGVRLCKTCAAATGQREWSA